MSIESVGKLPRSPNSSSESLYGSYGTLKSLYGSKSLSSSISAWETKGLYTDSIFFTERPADLLDSRDAFLR